MMPIQLFGPRSSRLQILVLVLVLAQITSIEPIDPNASNTLRRSCSMAPARLAGGYGSISGFWGLWWAGGRWFVLMIQKERPDSISSQAFFLSVGPVAPVVAYLLYVRRNSGSQNFWNLDTS